MGTALSGYFLHEGIQKQVYLIFIVESEKNRKIRLRGISIDGSIITRTERCAIDYISFLSQIIEKYIARDQNNHII